MSFCRFKTGLSCRGYSQATVAATTTAAAADVTSRAIPSSYVRLDRKKPSFAKSLYVGNFLKDVFVRRVGRIDIPKCEQLYGVSVPKRFGGLELCSTSVSEIYKSVGLKNINDYLAHGGVVKCINAHGTDDQKENYLPLLASGEYTASFCMYENKCGYDIQDTETKASCIDGQWVINGSKHWVINGKRANIFLVLAKTMDECNRPESDEQFFTAFLVKKSNGGIEVTSGEDDLCHVSFNNVRADCMLGPENEGLILYSMLFRANLLESSSATLGELKKIIQSTCRYIEPRTRSSLIKLGKLNSHLYTMDCVLGFTNLILDSYDPDSDYEPILARLFVSETTRSCLDLLNDLGLSNESFKYIENSLLFEGKSNLLKFVGALLGIQFAGQFMVEDVKQLRNPLMFPKYTLTHIMKIQRLLKDKPKLNHYIENYMHPSLKKQALDLEYCLVKFQFGVQNMFINLGPDTCYFQMILERANNVAMDLFALSAVLHRVSHELSNNSNTQLYPTKLIFANLFCNSVRQQCSMRISEILDAPHNVIDPHLKSLGQHCFIEKNYFFEHPLKRNIV